MNSEELIGKKFTYNNTSHIIKNIRKINNGSKDMILVYSDTLYPVNYDIIFVEDIWKGKEVNIKA